jgi:DNA-binding protein HU-beta
VGANLATTISSEIDPPEREAVTYRQVRAELFGGPAPSDDRKPRVHVEGDGDIDSWAATSVSCSNPCGASRVPPPKLGKEIVMPPAKKPAPVAKKAPVKAGTAKRAATQAKDAAPKKAAPAAQKAAPARKAISAKTAPQATITLRQIAAELAEGHDLPKRQAEAVLGDLVALAVNHLKKGDKIRLTGLGILQVRARPARIGRNPATGQSIKIAASKKIAFRPAKELKEAV